MLTRVLSPWSEASFALLRLLGGLMFATHGFQKLFGVLGGKVAAVGSQAWVGGVIEVVCGFAIAFGFFTRRAAFLASGTMAVAYVQFHWKGALGQSFFPTFNKGELALLYALFFFYVACRGPGRFSLDARRGVR